MPSCSALAATLVEHMYVDYEGVLYAVPLTHPGDITIGGETRSVMGESPTKLAVRVIVDRLAFDGENPNGRVVGQELYLFPYEYIDGKWLFTEFPRIG